MISHQTVPEIRFTAAAPRRCKPLNLTHNQVEDRLHEAISTLAALPDRERRYIYAKQSHWPETLPEAIDVMAKALERVRDGKSAFELPRAPRPTPTKEAIGRMDEALDWLAWLDRRALGVMMARALGAGWHSIAGRFRVSDRTVQRWHDAAVDTVRCHLRDGDALDLRPRVTEAHERHELRRLARRLFR